ncbi:hypothetical protein AX15_005421 [Amanita polypyramis BW_CC]|nr:hypothetical protein AX15_005421 [Amanita polypyramis BW_CC]
MSSHSGGTPGGSRPPVRNKQTWTVSSHALGEALAPLSQKQRSAPPLEPDSDIDIEQDWEERLPLHLPPSLSFPGRRTATAKFQNLGPAEVSQPDNLLTIELTARRLQDLLHAVEGSSFGFAS